MTGLRERLGQVSARIAPGAGGFWTWWSQSLLSWLPLRWQALLGVSDARLLLEAGNAQLLLSLQQNGQRQMLQALPADATPHAVDAPLGIGEGAILLQEGRARQEDMRVIRRLV